MRNLYTHLEFLNESENEYKKFEELSKAEQDLALEKNEDVLIYEDWYKDAIESFEESLEEYGISDIESTFSGFHSQGDGASFTSKSIDSAKFLKKAIGLKTNELLDLGKDDSGIKNDLSDLISDLEDLGYDNVKIDASDLYIEFYRSSNSHVHENSVSVRLELDGVNEPEEWDKDTHEKWDEFLGKLEDKIEEWRIEQCGVLYTALETEYESLSSEETIKDHLISGDYDIDPSTGKIIW